MTSSRKGTSAQTRFVKSQNVGNFVNKILITSKPYKPKVMITEKRMNHCKLSDLESKKSRAQVKYKPPKGLGKLFSQRARKGDPLDLEYRASLGKIYMDGRGQLAQRLKKKEQVLIDKEKRLDMMIYRPIGDLKLEESDSEGDISNSNISRSFQSRRSISQQSRYSKQSAESKASSNIMLRRKSKDLTFHNMTKDSKGRRSSDSKENISLSFNFNKHDSMNKIPRVNNEMISLDNSLKASNLSVNSGFGLKIPPK